MRRSWLPSVAEIRLVVLGGIFAGLVVVRVQGWHPAQANPIDSPGAVSAHFSLCYIGGGFNCVVDGDTIWLGGEKIRLADIDTPETHPPRCASEAQRGRAATERLQALLNAGPVTLTAIDRDTDRYGRKLRIVEREGVSVGEILVAEGLARRYAGGPRAGWCGGEI